MRVAITGANGFIGRHLVRRFTEAGWTVRAVIRRDLESRTVEDLFAGADVVVHAAGATRAPSPQRLRTSNVDLTAHVLHAAARASVGRFVFISSQAAAGPAPALHAPISESNRPAPVEAYGQSKLDAEALVHASPLPSVVLRPAAVYGPYDRDFLALYRLAARGVAIHPGNREQWISIIHVDDVARAVIIAAADDRAIGGTFFLANPDPVQWSELFRRVAQCAEKTLAIDVEVPSPLVKLSAMAGDAWASVTGHAGLMTSGKVALAKAPFWVCSARHASTVMDFSPAVELQRGLCDTYHWYRAAGWI